MDVTEFARMDAIDHEKSCWVYRRAEAVAVDATRNRIAEVVGRRRVAGKCTVGRDTD